MVMNNVVLAFKLHQINELFFLPGDDERALEDFKMAAKLGSEFAKHQVMLMNPYAALCNQMLGEVMSRIKRGEM